MASVRREFSDSTLFEDDAWTCATGPQGEKDDYNASTCATRHQGNRWVDKARRIPRRSRKLLRKWIDANLRGGNRPLVKPTSLLHAAFSLCDSGYESLATSPRYIEPLRFEPCFGSPPGGIAWPLQWESLGTNSIIETDQSHSQISYQKRLDDILPFAPDIPSEDGITLFRACSPVGSRVNEPIGYEFTSLEGKHNRMSLSDYSCHSDTSLTHSGLREEHSANTTGTITESDSSEDIPSPSPEGEAWLTIAYVRHRMVVRLMRDVYALFDPQWRPNFRAQTGSQEAASTTAHTQSPSLRAPSSTRNDNLGQGRDSNSPDANDTKVRKRKSPNIGKNDHKRPFACSFHKYDAQKYCSNRDTGTKYRSCAGPGFSKISQLKQHLKRNHRAPIYCPRCWLVMGSQTEMVLHANSEVRCEKREPQVQEGADEDKMRLIIDTWGVSWEKIYEILFPGAPIPSPYYEADDPSPENLEPSSPRSQELRDFEAYNRTALPLLVEANLRTMVESQIAPIEEHVRAMVVEIVRTCQSTVARNFQLAISSTPPAEAQTQSSSQTVNLQGVGVNLRAQPARVVGNDTPDNSSDFFREPPHLDMEPDFPFAGSMSSGVVNRNPASDSGYSSLPLRCVCFCHKHTVSWDEHPNAYYTESGRPNCSSCAHMHVDPDFNDLYPNMQHNDFDGNDIGMSIDDDTTSFE